MRITRSPYKACNAEERACITRHCGADAGLVNDDINHILQLDTTCKEYVDDDNLCPKYKPTTTTTSTTTEKLIDAEENFEMTESSNSDESEMRDTLVKAQLSESGAARILMNSFLLLLAMLNVCNVQQNEFLSALHV